MTEQEPIFSDDDMVRSVCAGHTQNFEVLVNRYKTKIINFIYKMISDRDEAHSLAQDVFLKVFEAIKKYKMQDNFQAFIFTIARNLTLNYIKKHKRIAWFSGQSSPYIQESRHLSVEGTQYTDIESMQRDELMNQGLQSLKENQRIALILKVYLEFSYKRIAEVTGWSEPKIETLISRAKSNLKKYIQAQPGVKTGHSGKKVQDKQSSNVLKMRSI